MEQTRNAVLSQWYLAHNPDQRNAIRQRMQVVLNVSRQTVWNYLTSKTPITDRAVETMEREFDMCIFTDAKLRLPYYKVIETPKAMKVMLDSSKWGCRLSDFLAEHGIEVRQVIINPDIDLSTIIVTKSDRIDELIYKFFTTQ